MAMTLTKYGAQVGTVENHSKNSKKNTANFCENGNNHGKIKSSKYVP